MAGMGAWLRVKKPLDPGNEVFGGDDGPGPRIEAGVVVNQALGRWCGWLGHP
jgi:hypothetical protein